MLVLISPQLRAFRRHGPLEWSLKEKNPVCSLGMISEAGPDAILRGEPIVKNWSTLRPENRE